MKGNQVLSHICIVSYTPTFNESDEEGNFHCIWGTKFLTDFRRTCPVLSPSLKYKYMNTQLPQSFLDMLPTSSNELINKLIEAAQL